MPQPYPNPKQFVAFHSRDGVPAGALRFLSFAYPDDQTMYCERFNNGSGYLSDYTWTKPNGRPTYPFCVADMGLGRDWIPADYAGHAPGTVTTIAEILTHPHRESMTFTQGSLPCHGFGNLRVQGDVVVWAYVGTASPNPGHPSYTSSAIVTVGYPRVIPDTLRPGQIVDERDLRAMPLEVTEGVVLLLLDSSIAPEGTWAAGTRFKVFCGDNGQPAMCYSANLGGPPDARLDDEDPTGWVPWQPTSRTFIVYKVPERTPGVHVPAAPGTPQCPLCNRYAYFITQGARHRTVPNGDIWCRGSEVATALNGLLSTTKCPRCSEACWTGTVTTHTPTGVTGCPVCVALSTRLYDLGAEPHELRFGVELETESLSWRKEAAELAKPRKGKHWRSGKGEIDMTIGQGWTAKADGSLRGPVDKYDGGYKNAEVISPPLYFNDANMAEVQVMTRELRYKGARHADRCGLHVHVGMEALSVKHVKDLVEWWYVMQPTILAALPPWANRVRFCQSMPADTVLATRRSDVDTKHLLARLRGNERYQALNLASLDKHGTVEFRFFNGSLHAAKVSAYIELCVRLASYASRHPYIRVGSGTKSPTSFPVTRAGMVDILDRLGFAPGNTSSRWHLLGTFASEADRPGPPGSSALDLKPAAPVRPAEPFPDPDYDESLDEEDDGDDPF